MRMPTASPSLASSKARSSARFCLVNRSMNDRVVGILRDDTVATRPRLAWIFDDSTFRIKAMPTDSVTCFVKSPMDEVD